jgi:hypothetical protein
MNEIRVRRNTWGAVEDALLLDARDGQEKGAQLVRLGLAAYAQASPAARCKALARVAELESAAAASRTAAQEELSRRARKSLSPEED